jgi:two-component system NarL family sensor kinase
MSSIESDILWIVFVVTSIIVLFAVFFVIIITNNHKRVISAQREKLAESQRLADILRRVPIQILNAQEQERGRVAKELHDGINQMLASIKYRLHALKLQQPLKIEKQNEWMEQVSGDLDTIMEEVRRISHALLPKIFTDYGFPAAVKSLCDGYGERTHSAIHYELAELPAHLSKSAELSIYRILQEVFHNIEKHAKATSISLVARREKAVCTMRIKDNGNGFDVRALANNGDNANGIGLRTMRERAVLIGGTLEVVSSPGYGTEIILNLPLRN